MSQAELPERASLEYLKKLAKDRLSNLRATQPDARLAHAQLAVAKDHGFASWRELKAAVDRRRAPALAAFFAACQAGEEEAVRTLLADDSSLLRERDGHGRTGLHRAARYSALVRVLLEQGADPNVRDEGDNALPLHFAAQSGAIEAVRALLDAGSDVHGAGDVHRLEVIGWATALSAEPSRALVELLVQRGARHHVFSLIALGDRDGLRQLFEEDPECLRRRLSRFEQEQTALHYVIAPPDGLVAGSFRTGEHHATLELLLELGAQVSALDARGRTPFELALLRGDREAARRLQLAGAELPVLAATPPAELSQLAGAIQKLTPSVHVRDMSRSIAWYSALGFTLRASHEHDGVIDWASLELGEAAIMLMPSAEPTARLGLWIGTTRIDDMYARVRQRQLEHARGALRADALDALDAPAFPFVEDLYTAFYGLRQFSVRDPDGVTLFFTQAAG